MVVTTRKQLSESVYTLMCGYGTWTLAGKTANWLCIHSYTCAIDWDFNHCENDHFSDKKLTVVLLLLKT